MQCNLYIFGIQRVWIPLDISAITRYGCEINFRFHFIIYATTHGNNGELHYLVSIRRCRGWGCAMAPCVKIVECVTNINNIDAFSASTNYFINQILLNKYFSSNDVNLWSSVMAFISLYSMISWPLSTGCTINLQRHSFCRSKHELLNGLSESSRCHCDWPSTLDCSRTCMGYNKHELMQYDCADRAYYLASKHNLEHYIRNIESHRNNLGTRKRENHRIITINGSSISSCFHAA